MISNRPADEIEENKNIVVGLLEQQSDMIIGVEKILPRQWTKDNITLETDQFSTDFWFFTTDPETELIQTRNSSRVQR